ncbi:hypothetical protein R1flu_006226 [Riccia fluitans]|uniref:DRBM domain-containing protein n=1 Tax=Riccia fluitans TaxID=41844 RepID=A0ABD1YZG7_9MARC
MEGDVGGGGGGGLKGMYKNQLQELAQRSCFNLPAYACIREGPDHAPRFKATVNFNGEIFESPNYCSTLRQAEHAAAEVALNTLSRRGPSQSLAARILDETGVCKNLLQETAQRAGVSLPVYTTTRSGPGHLPVFTCQVELARMKFDGEAAKTKKQAEKNAAMAAWSALKQFAVQYMSTSSVPESEVTEEQEQNTIARALASVYGKEERPVAQIGLLSQASSSQVPTPSSRVRVVNVRDRGQAGAGPAVSQYHSGPWMPVDMPQPDSLQVQRYMPNHQHASVLLRSGPPYRTMVAPRTHSSTSSPVRDSPVSLSREALAASRAASSIDNVRGRVNVNQVTIPRRRDPHEVSLPLDEHQKDEEEWLRGETAKPKTEADTGESSDKDRSAASSIGHSTYNSMMWSSSSQQWWNMQASHHGMAGGRRFPTGHGIAPPVRVRPVVTVSAAPPRRPEPEDSENDSTEGEAATRQVLSQLSL